jgi:hypothetical protein
MEGLHLHDEEKNTSDWSSLVTIFIRGKMLQNRVNREFVMSRNAESLEIEIGRGFSVWSHGQLYRSGKKGYLPI